MWCFVSEPNGIIHEIFLPNNAIGQDCFDRVLYDFRGAKKGRICIIVRKEILVKRTLILLFFQVCEKFKLAERDYFGLKYNGAKGIKLWLNLRNSMVSQLTGKPPHRLYFLVKFFVRPQELQQEITR